jgi:hypothetical protein
MAKKPGFGSLRINDRKQIPTHPDYTGFVILAEDAKAGDEIKLGAWKNDYNGYNLKQNTWKPDGQAKPAYPRPVTRDDDDNSVPF